MVSRGAVLISHSPYAGLRAGQARQRLERDAGRLRLEATFLLRILNAIRLGGATAVPAHGICHGMRVIPPDRTLLP
jgi:hypothetical protein